MEPKLIDYVLIGWATFSVMLVVYWKLGK